MTERNSFIFPNEATKNKILKLLEKHDILEYEYNNTKGLTFEVLDIIKPARSLPTGYVVVKINGKKYRYQPSMDLPINEFALKLSKIAKHSAGKALAWLKKNASLQGKETVEEVENEDMLKVKNVSDDVLKDKKKILRGSESENTIKIDDNTIVDIDSLSSKQIRDLLTKNKIDHKQLDDKNAKKELIKFSKSQVKEDLSDEELESLFTATKNKDTTNKVKKPMSAAEKMEFEKFKREAKSPANKRFLDTLAGKK